MQEGNCLYLYTLDLKRQGQLNALPFLDGLELLFV
jgi:hypothetical protein